MTTKQISHKFEITGMITCRNDKGIIFMQINGSSIEDALIVDTQEFILKHWRASDDAGIELDFLFGRDFVRHYEAHAMINSNEQLFRTARVVAEMFSKTPTDDDRQFPQHILMNMQQLQ